MPDAPDRFIALPPLAFRVGVTGAARLDAAAQDVLRSQVAVVLGRVRTELEALAANVRAAGIYNPGKDGLLHPGLRIVSPLGAGADRLVTEEALRFGYALEVPLPFTQPAYEGTFPDSVAEFRALLAAAGPRAFVLDGNADDDVARSRSYGEAGRLVVRNCDLLIAIWDDTKPAKGPGGTTDTVHFAVQSGVPVWWLHPDGAHEPRLLVDRLHLAQPEDAPSGEDTLNAWLHRHLDDIILPPRPPHPSAHGMFARVAHRLKTWSSVEGDPLRTFLAEVQRENHLLWKVHGWVLGSPWRGRPRPVGAQVAPSHPAAHLARLYQARYRSSYVYVFVLAAIALVAAVLGLAFEAVEAVTAPIELATLVLILILVMANLVQSWQDRYMSCRLLAELFRLQGRLATLGWSLPPLQVSGLAGRSGRSWVGWYFAAVVRGSPLPDGVLTTERLREAQRSADQELLDGQIRFHQRRREQKERSGSTLERWGEGLFLGTLLVVVVKAVLLFSGLGHGAPSWLGPSLGLVAALVPAASAVFFGVRAYEEMEVLADQSEQMLEALRAAKARIAAVRPDQPLASQLLGTELFEVASLMLADVGGWAQLFRMKAVGAG